MIAGDVGLKTTDRIITAVKEAARNRTIKNPADVLPFLKNYVADILRDDKSAHASKRIAKRCPGCWRQRSR